MTPGRPGVGAWAPVPESEAHLNSALEAAIEALHLLNQAVDHIYAARGPKPSDLTTEADGTTTIQFPPGTFARLAETEIGVHVTCASCGASSELGATTCSACGASDDDE